MIEDSVSNVEIEDSSWNVVLVDSDGNIVLEDDIVPIVVEPHHDGSFHDGSPHDGSGDESCFTREDISNSVDSETEGSCFSESSSSGDEFCSCCYCEDVPTMERKYSFKESVELENFNKNIEPQLRVQLFTYII